MQNWESREEIGQCTSCYCFLWNMFEWKFTANLNDYIYMLYSTTHVWIRVNKRINIHIYHGFASIVYWCYLFLPYFGYSTFFGYEFGKMRVNIVIFIKFRVHQVQLQKVPLNGNKKGGFQGCPEGWKRCTRLG